MTQQSTKSSWICIKWTEAKTQTWHPALSLLSISFHWCGAQNATRCLIVHNKHLHMETCSFHWQNKCERVKAHCARLHTASEGNGTLCTEEFTSLTSFWCQFHFETELPCSCRTELRSVDLEKELRKKKSFLLFLPSSVCRGLQESWREILYRGVGCQDQWLWLQTGRSWF